MARKRQRYKKLMEQLKASGINAEAGSRTANFLKYITGQTKLTQKNTIPAKARERFLVALHPFAISAAGETPADRYEAYMSAYSIKGLQNRAIVQFNDLGINLVVGGEQSNPLYFPALLRAKYSSSTDNTATDKTSNITGDTYKYKYGRTFSFPFGRTTQEVTDATKNTAITVLDDADELDVLESLKNKITAGQDDSKKPESISYEPEEFRTAPIAKVLQTEANDVGSFTMPEIETIDWKELTGNKFNKTLHPAMLSEKGFVRQMSLRRIGDKDKTIFDVAYNRHYVIEYLGKIVCKNLQVLGIEQILDLVEEAWYYTYPNAKAISSPTKEKT